MAAFKPRLKTFLALAVVGATLGVLTPRVASLASLDLRVFGWVSGHPGEVSGVGTLEEPRKIEIYGEATEPRPLEVLYLDDEESGFFEVLPPPPSDVMVVLARLQERGVRALGFGYPLQWEQADTLAVNAMRRVMDRFDGLVLGFPLKDSTAAVPVAAPFQRASVAYHEVRGDGTKMPVVNGIRGVAPEMGGDRSWGGFTRIETEEPDEERAYLLARWSDRVVFALPVVAEVARRGLSFDEVEVVMGEHVQLGEGGPRIPIDFRGRVDLPVEGGERWAEKATGVIAENLPEGFARGKGMLYVTDERLLGGKAEREWAEQLNRLDAAIRQSPVRVGNRVMRVLPQKWEWAMVVGVAGLVGFFTPVTSMRGAWVGALLWLVVLGGALAVGIRVVAVAPMPLAVLAIPVAVFPLSVLR
ncbi:MAG: hypothetical protein ACQKBU_07220, partial [Verrucomicrobiales bacterium]